MTTVEQINALKREAEEERCAIARSIGIGEEFRPLCLVHNQASGMVVASVERAAAGSFDRRLFFRHTVEGAYRPLGSSRDGLRYDNPVSSPRLPVVYYTVWQVTPGSQGGEFGGDWLSVERFEFGPQSEESVITRGGLRFPEPYEGGWVSQLISVAVDDSVIYCSCGMRRMENLKVHYWLCAVEPRTQKVTLLSRLEGVWF